MCSQASATYIPRRSPRIFPGARLGIYTVYICIYEYTCIHVYTVRTHWNPGSMKPRTVAPSAPIRVSHEMVRSDFIS